MIKERAEKILKELPLGVELLVAGKGRSAQEIEQALSAGIKIIGENYVQEAEEKRGIIARKASWHLIGHLQKNKVKKAVSLFDMIQTLDSLALAQSLDKECERTAKVMPMLIEVNIARETNKYGVLPENVESLVKDILRFKNIKVMGLMTMGPLVEDPQKLRLYFKQAKQIFDKIKSLGNGKLDWVYLSMGMSSSYKIAIEEGANMVRLGTAIFGER